MAEGVKQLVHGREYASESEVVRDGLPVLLVRDCAVEIWLHVAVAVAIDGIKADPGSVLTAAQVRKRLADENAKAGGG